VIGKLEVIFRLNAVTIEVRVLRQLAILFQHLGRVAPGAAIDPVKLLSTTLRAIVAAAAPTVVTTIVIQLRHFPNLVRLLQRLCDPFVLRMPRNPFPHASPHASGGSQHLAETDLEGGTSCTNGGAGRDGKPSSVALPVRLISDAVPPCQVKSC
jgi:hypothetical protein